MHIPSRILIHLELIYLFCVGLLLTTWADKMEGFLSGQFMNYKRAYMATFKVHMMMHEQFYC